MITNKIFQLFTLKTGNYDPPNGSKSTELLIVTNSKIIIVITNFSKGRVQCLVKTSVV